MARQSVSVQQIVKTGLEAAYTNAHADGHEFSNDGRTFMHVVNGDGADKTITIQTPQTVGGLAVADLAVTVTAGEERMIGPFRKSLFDQANGKVYVDFSATTNVTAAYLKL